MYILGISAYLCDSSAALVKDGRLLGAIEEEKLVAQKHTGELPVNAIKHLLKEENISLSDIDHVAYFFKPFMGLHHRLWMIIKNLPGSLTFYQSHGGMWQSMVRVRHHLNRAFQVKNPKYRFHNVAHHLSHAASSFLISDFKEAAILTVDGSGEWTATMMCAGKNNKILPLKELYYPHSLGYLYASVTEYLGFKPNSGEGKVMGLASYGRPQYIDTFRKIVKLGEKGAYRLDLSYFDYYKHGITSTQNRSWVSQKFVSELGPPRTPESKIESRHEDIAASLQQVLEEVMLHMVNYLWEETKMENLCLAGGVALNSVANGFIIKRSKFKKIFIQPAAGDGGTSVGAAFYTYHCRLNQPRIRVPETVFIGPKFSESEILKALESHKLPYKKTDPPEAGAQLLAEGKILGWFQGRIEFGPRALGNRSIIADPRKAEMKDIINARVKFRESFRPFAPSILEEKLEEYFDFNHPSPTMLLVYNVLPEKWNVIPAVTHVDGTGRVQSISRTDNPLYYDLINHFYRLTGVPVILNTSFNVRGKPIVCTPEQALDCFLKTDMDNLIIGDYLVSKRSARE